MKLTQEELHSLFLKDMGQYVGSVIQNTNRKPLIVDLKAPFCCRAKIYLFNCTNPPGGRARDEYKVQLILTDQKRGQHGHLDDSDGMVSILIGYADIIGDLNDGAYVIFDTELHREFAYSANIQVYLHQMFLALTNDVAVVQKRGNHETMVIAMRMHLSKAMKMRFDLDTMLMLGEDISPILTRKKDESVK